MIIHEERDTMSIRGFGLGPFRIAVISQREHGEHLELSLMIARFEVKLGVGVWSMGAM